MDLFIFFSVSSLVTALIACVLYLLLRPIVHGAIYFPTTSRNVGVMLRLARVAPGKRVVDLGSGDGRIVVACARAGAEAHGYEINPLLVWQSRRVIRKEKLQGKAFIHWKSFWDEDLARFDVVMVYGIPYIMRHLQKKLTKELKPSARVVSHVFRFPDWRHSQSEERIFLYEPTT